MFSRPKVAYPICGSCKQPCPGSQTYADLLVSTSNIFRGTNCTRYITIYIITHRERPQHRTLENKKVKAFRCRKVLYPSNFPQVSTFDETPPFPSLRTTPLVKKLCQLLLITFVAVCCRHSPLKGHYRNPIND